MRCAFIEAKAADILDMYRGVAEKRILALFETARARKPAVLFFDEVEALAQRAVVVEQRPQRGLRRGRQRLAARPGRSAGPPRPWRAGPAGVV